MKSIISHAQYREHSIYKNYFIYLIIIKLITVTITVNAADVKKKTAATRNMVHYNV